MISNPFPLLQQFSDRLTVAFFDKSDDIRSDAQAGKVLGVERTAGLWQVHGSKTEIVREPTNRTLKADGMATDTKGLLLTIRAADCQNFVFFDPVKNVVSVLHAGWRGLIAGAITEHITALKKEWHCDPADLHVGAGPSLCFACAEFTDPVAELPGFDPKLLNRRKANLQEASTQEMVKNGIPREHIDRMPDCTKCHPEKYWTYRGGDHDAVIAGHTNMLVIGLVD